MNETELQALIQEIEAIHIDLVIKLNRFGAAGIRAARDNGKTSGEMVVALQALGRAEQTAGDLGVDLAALHAAAAALASQKFGK